MKGKSSSQKKMLHSNSHNGKMVLPLTAKLIAAGIGASGSLKPSIFLTSEASVSAPKFFLLCMLENIWMAGRGEWENLL